MSKPTDGQRCVANLLRRAEATAPQQEGLAALMHRVDEFFVAAQSAPEPVNLEDQPDGSEAHETELVLNVVAGVFEEKQSSHLQNVDGVVLPTEANKQRLLADKMGESIAMLNLMAALTGRTMQSGRQDENGSRGAGGDAQNDWDDDASSSSSGCAVMDASSGSDEDASPVHRRPVTEL